MLVGLRVSFAAVVLVATFANAPFQCASEPDLRRRRVEDPSEVLFALAERFEAKGERDAQVATLRYLIERYPSSRFAGMARQDLESLGVPPTETNTTGERPPE
ncbi:tetratricopeptide repeat protein [Chondromyces crocatus]|uniref:Outer membrane lipoprotein BamD-like domain-containing protein n=1 Tax=Chondromyces crocatus TaxID=52 RepID=A0A0K1EHE7_CHOCO|nr:hypothetical protein [Chondromyces crocatus]AKT40296.1 uncharacterized protein CMC5_044490 [Chondromyces crocatus]